MPRHAAILTALLATTASAQTTVPVTGSQTVLGGSFQRSPNAAYSNITNSPNNNSGVGGPLLPTSFDDLTATPSTQGQVVRQLRVPVAIGQSVPNPAPLSMRVLVGFWNADAPNGLAGTPIQGLHGAAAHYQSAIINNVPPGRTTLWTLDLGNTGFVVPAGRFFVGISLDTSSTPVPVSGLTPFLMNYSPPTVGTTQLGFYRSSNPQVPGVSLSGIPWGQTLGLPGGPELGSAVASQGPGIELIVPAPPSIGALVLCGLCASRRRRSR